MKKFFMLPVLAALAIGSVFAQEFTVSGELKTGFYWERKQQGDNEVEETGYVHNNDDAGANQGRFRLNMQLDKENVGMKVRFEQTLWTTSTPGWAYSFAYGYFLDNQLKISGGKLGDSPWAAGGPERWDELDTKIGIRTELMPQFIPGLNIGFVLNDWDQGLNISTTNKTIDELLKETVLGASYENDYFGVRVAFRGDSILDNDANRQDDGSKLLYRVEERALQKVLEGFQIWANGYYDGIQSEKGLVYYNWLYFQYAPEVFTTQIRVGLDAAEANRQVLHIRPSFYYNLFDKLVTAGLAFSYRQDFGSKYSEGSPYQQLWIEPQIKLNLANTYVALVYRYSNEYTSLDQITETHWVNLRLVFTF
ncbi:MAG: hypothetical protein LBS97_05535 [Treponema sp.]|jgi:hypothetical protein|nr:hypothetical protein [Treponema sp.]